MAEAPACNDSLSQLNNLFESALQAVLETRFDLAAAQQFLKTAWTVADSLQESQEKLDVATVHSITWANTRITQFLQPNGQSLNMLDSNQFRLLMLCVLACLPHTLDIRDGDGDKSVVIGYPLAESRGVPLLQNMNQLYLHCDLLDNIKLLNGVYWTLYDLLALCTVMERKRPVVACFCALQMHINMLAFKQLPFGLLFLRLDEFLQNATIMTASCLIRAGYFGKARILLEALPKVVMATMPVSIAYCYNFARAHLQKETEQWDGALKSAQFAARCSEDQAEKTMETDELIGQLKREVENVDDKLPDDDWLMDSNTKQTETDAQKRKQKEQKTGKGKSKNKRRKRSQQENRSAQKSEQSVNSSKAQDDNEKANEFNSNSEESVLCEPVVNTRVAEGPSKPLSYAAACKNSVSDATSNVPVPGDMTRNTDRSLSYADVSNNTKSDSTNNVSIASDIRYTDRPLPYAVVCNNSESDSTSNASVASEMTRKTNRKTDRSRSYAALHNKSDNVSTSNASVTSDLTRNTDRRRSHAAARNNSESNSTSNVSVVGNMTRYTDRPLSYAAVCNNSESDSTSNGSIASKINKKTDRSKSHAAVRNNSESDSTSNVSVAGNMARKTDRKTDRRQWNAVVLNASESDSTSNVSVAGSMTRYTDRPLSYAAVCNNSERGSTSDVSVAGDLTRNTDRRQWNAVVRNNSESDSTSNVSVASDLTRNTGIRRSYAAVRNNSTSNVSVAGEMRNTGGRPSYAAVCKNSESDSTGDALEAGDTVRGADSMSVNESMPSPSASTTSRRGFMDSDSDGDENPEAPTLMYQMFDDSDAEEEGLETSMQNTPLLLPFEDEKPENSSWYQQSLSDSYDEQQQVIHISEQELKHFERESDWCFEYYSHMSMTKEQLEEKLRSNPDQYKRCQLKLRSSHYAEAKVLDKQGHGRSEYIIEGRSKIGRTFMDDEVVLEVYPDPVPPDAEGNIPESTPTFHKQTHGKVVGILKQNAFPDVPHPIMYCTVNERETFLMRPLCKSVPKIFVLRDNVPRESENMIEIYSVSPKGSLEHKRFFKLNPDNMEQYVFKVVYLTWRYGRSRYPLGAVLGVRKSGKDFKAGIELLSLKHGLTTLYPPDVVEQIRQLLQEDVSTEGREDLRGKRVFTVDPPNSKDLDDAVSIEEQGSTVIIGVHIADVAAAVKPGTPVDDEAKKRAVTFYPEGYKPHHMLPEPLAGERCSLLPDKDRLALSCFFKFDHKGNQVEEEVTMKKTLIKSRQKLTYSEVQRVLNNDKNVTVDNLIRGDIHKLHRITTRLKERRLKMSRFFVPLEDPRLSDPKQAAEDPDAHSMIEELMILTNASVANLLVRKFPQTMLLRCHDAPTPEELAEWLEKEGPIAHLVMKLQDKTITPNNMVSLIQLTTASAQQHQNKVYVQADLWKRLQNSIERGDWREARQIAFMDEAHPLQCLANSHFIELMQSAEYRCSYALNTRRHFGLDKEVYTHFTSPIRRYADLHVQRLLHAHLDHPEVDRPASYCSREEVVKLGEGLTRVFSRQKAFGRACVALKLASKLQNQPLVFRSVVDTVDTEQIKFCIPSMPSMSARKQELPFSALGVSCQPDLTTNTMLHQDSVKVRISRKIFSAEGIAPKSLVALGRQQHIYTPDTSSYEERPGEKKGPLPADMVISREQLTVSFNPHQWAKVLSSLTASSVKKFHPPEPMKKNAGEVEYMSSEKGTNNKACLRPVRYDTTFTPGHVLQLQVSAKADRGLLEPTVELVHVARNFSICSKHLRDPAKTLTRTATVSTRNRQFNSHDEYLRAWMQLVEMEAAVDAGDVGGAVVLEDVKVKMMDETRGRFNLKDKISIERNISIGGKAPGRIKKDESSGVGGFPLDYLCLRYHLTCPSKVVSRVEGSNVREITDSHFTWLAHASVTEVTPKKCVVVVSTPHTPSAKPARKGKKAAKKTVQKTVQKPETMIEYTGILVVDFVLSHSSPSPPAELMTKKDGETMTVEILAKSEVERRAQEMLMKLDECELATAIAYGTTLPELDNDHLELGRDVQYHDVEFMRRNNWAQQEAIQTALTNSLSLIQGPPGTGKTFTGIKLIYLFTEINRKLCEDGKGHNVLLFCGPSNKSVDLVARLMKEKLDDKCPKFVRVYSSAIESKDYYIPRGQMKEKRGMKDLNSDNALLEETLHHIIRQADTPTADKIRMFESKFRRSGDATVEELREYNSLVFEASVAAIKTYDVVMTTCAVAGNQKLIKGLAGRAFQVMIDECGMCQEPHSMIPIIAAKAKQVVLIGDHKQLRPVIMCQPAADLGLDQSLFERLYQKFPDNTVFLNLQYRMHPAICAFPSAEFYNNLLKTGFSKLWHGEDYEKPLPLWPLLPEDCQKPYIPKARHKVLGVLPHLLVDVRGEEKTLAVPTDEGNEKSKSNEEEVKKVIEVLAYLKTQHVDNDRDRDTVCNVALLTQYNAQKHELEKAFYPLCTQAHSVFRRYDKENVKISTVVSSQGGEWDYVILSLVRSLPSYKIEPNPTLGWCRQNLGFITDMNQVNVALTRARKGLIIIGNVELLRCDKSWRKLVDRYTRLGCVVQGADFPPPIQNNSRPHYKRTKHSVSSSTDWQDV